MKRILLILHTHLPLTILIVAAILTIVLRYSTAWVDFYSSHIYPWVQLLLQHSFGLVPFSVGDIGYLLLLAWLMWWVAILVVSLVRYKKASATHLRRLARMVSILIIIFQLGWGTMYGQRTIYERLQIPTNEKNEEHLPTLARHFLTRAVDYRNQLRQNDVDTTSLAPSFDHIYRHAEDLTDKYAHTLGYSHTTYRIKSSIYPEFYSNILISGYYNPFTGEAQLNTQIPAHRRCFVACHELAHQMGFAKEKEANIVGFLIAQQSTDPYFLYSSYLTGFLYTYSELRKSDTAAYKSIRREISEPIWRDLRKSSRYYRQYKGSLSEVRSAAYNLYLKSNLQPKGVESYDLWVRIILDYYLSYHAEVFLPPAAGDSTAKSASTTPSGDIPSK